ncbi:MAG: AAA family ATPase [Gammaproteobacteria bacterium]|nr:AAA family ATPase [Gammaproteobacteria bacterium]MCI0590215.1 AAA family ATPase [Gammaproteobacteria bacterium]
MRQIIVMNAKGGCGKTTVATNLASFYASKGIGTALFDYDPQGASMRWLRQRPQDEASIYGVAAYQTPKSSVTRSWQLRVPPAIQRLVIDSPAGLKGQLLAEQVKSMDIIIVPVLPSSFDIYATADFIQDLLLVGKVWAQKTRIAIVANRLRKNTRAFEGLKRFLQSLRIPVIAELRDTQNYVRAAEQGIGVHELESRNSHQDKAPWAEMYDWLESHPKPFAT